mmetsp:Transcript_15542/g.60793  ORF Transcript_15542/g.60793 Transcript_15542/m.60793 type:complete len:816 (+) Transcript_15542:512-2959(+)
MPLVRHPVAGILGAVRKRHRSFALPTVVHPFAVVHRAVLGRELAPAKALVAVPVALVGFAVEADPHALALLPVVGPTSVVGGAVNVRDLAGPMFSAFLVRSDKRILALLDVRAWSIHPVRLPRSVVGVRAGLPLALSTALVILPLALVSGAVAVGHLAESTATVVEPLTSVLAIVPSERAVAIEHIDLKRAHVRAVRARQLAVALHAVSQPLSLVDISVGPGHYAVAVAEAVEIVAFVDAALNVELALAVGLVVLPEALVDAAVLVVDHLAPAGALAVVEVAEVEVSVRVVEDALLLLPLSMRLAQLPPAVVLRLLVAAGHREREIELPLLSLSFVVVASFREPCRDGAVRAGDPLLLGHDVTLAVHEVHGGGRDDAERGLRGAADAVVEPDVLQLEHVLHAPLALGNTREHEDIIEHVQPLEELLSRLALDFAFEDEVTVGRDDGLEADELLVVLYLLGELPVGFGLAHALVDGLGEVLELRVGLLQMGVVRVAGRRLLEQLIEEQAVARDALHGHDQEVTQLVALGHRLAVLQVVGHLLLLRELLDERHALLVAGVVLLVHLEKRKHLEEDVSDRRRRAPVAQLLDEAVQQADVDAAHDLDVAVDLLDLVRREEVLVLALHHRHIALLDEGGHVGDVLLLGVEDLEQDLLPVCDVLLPAVNETEGARRGARLRRGGRLHDGSRHGRRPARGRRRARLLARRRRRLRRSLDRRRDRCRLHHGDAQVFDAFGEHLGEVGGLLLSGEGEAVDELGVAPLHKEVHVLVDEALEDGRVDDVLVLRRDADHPVGVGLRVVEDEDLAAARVHALPRLRRR